MNRIQYLRADSIIHTRASPAAPPRSRGFTLLELLVVLVIIGVMAGMVGLSMGVLGGDHQSEEEARRFWTVLQQAREDAELQGTDMAVYVADDAYEYLFFEDRRQQWLPLFGDDLYRPRELPEGLRFRLRLEAREVVLGPIPQRGDLIESQRWPPQVMVLSSGEIMPFELELERDSQPALWRIVALADSDLRVERRDDRHGWVAIMTTLPDPQEREDAR